MVELRPFSSGVRGVFTGEGREAETVTLDNCGERESKRKRETETGLTGESDAGGSLVGVDSRLLTRSRTMLKTPPDELAEAARQSSQISCGGVALSSVFCPAPGAVGQWHVDGSWQLAGLSTGSLSSARVGYHGTEVLGTHAWEHESQPSMWHRAAHALSGDFALRVAIGESGAVSRRC